MIEEKIKPIAAKIAGRYSMIRINHPWGHGDWHHPSSRSVLQEHCKRLNVKYGAGTHYLYSKERKDVY